MRRCFETGSDVFSEGRAALLLAVLLVFGSAASESVSASSAAAASPCAHSLNGTSAAVGTATATTSFATSTNTTCIEDAVLTAAMEQATFQMPATSESVISGINFFNTSNSMKISRRSSNNNNDTNATTTTTTNKNYYNNSSTKIDISSSSNNISSRINGVSKSGSGSDQSNSMSIVAGSSIGTESNRTHGGGTSRRNNDRTFAASNNGTRSDQDDANVSGGSDVGDSSNNPNNSRSSSGGDSHSNNSSDSNNSHIENSNNNNNSHIEGSNNNNNSSHSNDSDTNSLYSSGGPTNGSAGEGVRLREPHYRPLVDTIVGTLVLGAILVVGVAGNAMVVAVVAQTRSMRTPTNCYLVSLSVADLMVLLSAIPNEILAQYILEDEWLFGRAGCALFVFSQYLGINASSLSITAFTVERYIAICLPMKAQTMCTVKRAKKIILAVWLFALCYCAPWLFFLTTTRPIFYRGHEHRQMETCTYSLQRSFYMRFFFADIILFYVIPLGLSCVLYGRMARVLFHTDIGAMACKSNGDAKANANNQSRIQVVKMLIVVVVLFATLWLPYRVLLVYNSFASKPYLELWYLMLCKTLIFVNSAINPVLYNAMSVKFRRAFRRTLSCGSGNRGGTRLESRGFTTVMTVHQHQQANLHRPPRKDQY